MTHAFQRIELLMGTGIDIDVRRADCTAEQLEGAVDQCFDRLRQIETMFTTYDPASEVCRLGRGELDLSQCHEDIQEIVQLSDHLRHLTGGYFDIHKAANSEPARSTQYSNHWNARPLEPSGIVKGWAVEEVVTILRRNDATDFCVFAGGDMYLAGEQAPGESWRIGLQHPTLPGKHMAALRLRDLAVATSGLYARGEHIVNPWPDVNSGSTSELLSVTIVGADITLTDAYATAVFAMGLRGLDWIQSQPGFAVYAVDKDHQAHFSSELEDLLFDDEDAMSEQKPSAG